MREFRVLLLLFIFLSVQTFCGLVSAKSHMEMTDAQIIKMIKKLDKKINRKEDNAKLYIQRGFYKFILKDYGSALEDYTTAEELTPKNSVIYYSKGRIWAEKKNYTSAIEEFDKAISLNKKDSKVYVSRGMAKQGLNDLNGAIADYNLAIKYCRSNSNAYINRGVVKYKQKNYDGAMSDFQKAIKLSKKYSPDAYYNLGLVQCQNEEYEDGIDSFSIAIEQNPKYALAYYNRGLAYLKVDNQQLAKSDFEKACQIEPSNKKYRESLNNVKEYLNNLLKEEEIMY